MATKEQAGEIAEAQKQKQRAVEALIRAFNELCDAQEHITDVVGPGSADIYNEIADVYCAVTVTRVKLSAMEPTGMFR